MRGGIDSNKWKPERPTQSAAISQSTEEDHEMGMWKMLILDLRLFSLSAPLKVTNPHFTSNRKGGDAPLKTKGALGSMLSVFKAETNEKRRARLRHEMAGSPEDIELLLPKSPPRPQP